MAAVIGRAGAKLNIRLGQSPEYQDPRINADLQQMYNSLHLLSQYMGVLRENLESAPGQTPAESVRFRRTFWAVAKQKIVEGAIVSSSAGGIVNGVGSNEVKNTVSYEIQEQLRGTGNRRTWGLNNTQQFVALTAADIGELVNVGVGPGITQITGAKCGQLIWGADSRAVLSSRRANTEGNHYSGRAYTNNGGVYLANITMKWFYYSGGHLNFEGYNSPGYPNHSGNRYYSSNVYLYPIGVCVADGYVLFTDFKRSDPLPYDVPN